jgi:uncharacterized tellurite resistance protein B-like protein
MSFSDLFDSGFKSRNKGYFASFVKIAYSDNVLTDDEKKFLDRIALKLEISADEYEEIVENPDKYPVDPPYLYIHRLERLYDLGRMVYADHVLGPRQKDILTRYAVYLGFTPNNIPYIVDKALSLLFLNVDIETFVYEMQHMNK